MDTEGTAISVVLFNKEIDLWQSMLARGHTYYISNGFVKAYDTRFRSAHPSLEITLNTQTIIEEVGDKLFFDLIHCNPVEFEHVKKQTAAEETVDMLGTLGSVYPMASFTHRKKNTLVPKRLITIRNSRLEEVTIALTSDLATNGGAELREIWPSEVIVRVTNLLLSHYQGNVTFSTTTTYVVLHGINPTNVVTLTQFVPGDELPTVKEQTVHARWPNALVVKIPDLLRKNNNE